METVKNINIKECLAYTNVSRQNSIRLDVYNQGDYVSYRLSSAELAELAEYLHPLKIIHMGALVSFSEELQEDVNKIESYEHPQYEGDIGEWFDLIDNYVMVYVIDLGSGYIRIVLSDELSDNDVEISMSLIFLNYVITELKARPHIKWRYIDSDVNIRYI